MSIMNTIRQREVSCSTAVANLLQMIQRARFNLKKKNKGKNKKCKSDVKDNPGPVKSPAHVWRKWTLYVFLNVSL